MRGLDLRSIYLQEKFGQERGRAIAKKKWTRGSSLMCVKLRHLVSRMRCSAGGSDAVRR
jgi:hypothetical protein